MPSQIKHLLSNLLVNNHKLIAPFMRNRHAPYRCAGGSIYLNLKESPMMLARALDVYEASKMAAVRHFLKPGMTFIDVGGNKGDFALLAARIAGDSGTILCFEPESDNCRWIRKSIALNGYKNVHLHEVALSDRDGSANLYLGQKSGWHTLLSGQSRSDAGTVTVQTSTLDGVLGRSAIRKADLLKIDVEGAEVAVLDGARETLLGNPGIVLLLDIHPRMGVKPRQVAAMLTDIGFSLYAMRPQFDREVHIQDDSRELIAYRAH